MKRLRMWAKPVGNDLSVQGIGWYEGMWEGATSAVQEKLCPVEYEPKQFSKNGSAVEG